MSIRAIVTLGHSTRANSVEKAAPETEFGVVHSDGDRERPIDDMRVRAGRRDGALSSRRPGRQQLGP